MQHRIDGIAHRPVPTPFNGTQRAVSCERSSHALFSQMAHADRLATMTMTLMQSLYDATGSRLEWRNIDLIVSQTDHFEALEYAVGQQ